MPAWDGPAKLALQRPSQIEIRDKYIEKWRLDNVLCFSYALVSYRWLGGVNLRWIRP